MNQAPRSCDEEILGRSEWIRIIWVGLLEATLVLGTYFFGLQAFGPVHARSLAFTTFVFSQLFRSFGARSRTEIFWEVGAFNNLWLLGVVFLTAALQVSLHYLPLSQRIFEILPLNLDDLMIILPISLIPITVIEMKKIILRWRQY